MSISTSRRLAEATSCWLHYEYLCQRAGLFDESALKSAVGQVLSSFIIDKPARAWSNAQHPVLSQFAGSGRKPEIDFVLAELNGNRMGSFRIAIEAKWADSTHSTPQNIIYDIFRLALLQRDLKSKNIPVDCVFLLAGTKSRIRKTLTSSPFIGKFKLPLRQGVSTSIKGNVFNSNKSGEWATMFQNAAGKSAKIAAEQLGFPDVTLSFSPGLPTISLSLIEENVADQSIKFYAMAWSVEGF